MNIIGKVVFFTLYAVSCYCAYSTAATTEGAQIWRNNCATCHGADGRGSPQIKEQLEGEIVDFTSLAFAETNDRKKMLLAVRDGVSNSIMPGFRDKLSYQQMLDVVDYATENFMLSLAMGENYQEGKKIFADNCSVCHGDQGQGAIWTAAGLFPKPANFTSPEKIAELTRVRMIFSVTNGRPETAMVSWKTRLSEQQVTAVVDYIRAAIMKVSDDDTAFGSVMGKSQDTQDPFLSAQSYNEQDIETITPSNTVTDLQEIDKLAQSGNDPFLESSAYQENEDPNIGQDDIYAGKAHDHQAHMGKKLNITDPLPNELIGDYMAGRNLYRDTCASCHGVKGNGQGPRSYFIFPKPRNFTHSAARASFSRAHIYERIRTGVVRTEMPAWGTVLTDQQMADIAEYVFMTFISQKRVDPDFWSDQVSKQEN
ncbi:c-type cytochrome [Thalassotalea sp. G2M2-11]|uniref:cytochrome c n=1 Tax=Thalassotalea sp. G2M2-11 TaxID=2787627 RepID=UPI0019D02C90|nr:c-type cytochrome [Thalassotalea sp. G2M2-11]